MGLNQVLYSTAIAVALLIFANTVACEAHGGGGHGGGGGGGTSGGHSGGAFSGGHSGGAFGGGAFSGGHSGGAISSGAFSGGHSSGAFSSGHSSGAFSGGHSGESRSSGFSGGHSGGAFIGAAFIGEPFSGEAFSGGHSGGAGISGASFEHSSGSFRSGGFSDGGHSNSGSTGFSTGGSRSGFGSGFGSGHIGMSIPSFNHSFGSGTNNSGSFAGTSKPIGLNKSGNSFGKKGLLVGSVMFMPNPFNPIYSGMNNNLLVYPSYATATNSPSADMFADSADSTRYADYENGSVLAQADPDGYAYGNSSDSFYWGQQSPGYGPFQFSLLDPYSNQYSYNLENPMLNPVEVAVNVSFNNLEDKLIDLTDQGRLGTFDLDIYTNRLLDLKRNYNAMLGSKGGLNDRQGDALSNDLSQFDQEIDRQVRRN